jgi:hypothetical protein
MWLSASDFDSLLATNKAKTESFQIDLPDLTFSKQVCRGHNCLSCSFKVGKLGEQQLHSRSTSQA